MTTLNKLSNWHFTKGAVPYWSILVLDSMIVLCSGLIGCYIEHGGNEVVDNFWQILCGMLCELPLFIISFHLFHTYQGIIRFSSYIDLYRIAKATLLGAILGYAFGRVLIMPWSPLITHHLIAIPDFKSSLILFGISTFIIWMVRLVVKAMFESFNTDNAMPVAIYGTQAGGIALANSIKSVHDKQYLLKCFVTDDKEMSKARLMAKEVLLKDDNVVGNLKKHNVKALLVSPLKSEAFRDDSQFVDALTEASIKIMMMPTPEVWDGKSELTYSHLKEVEIEDLLPRDEIKVDMDAIGAMLTGKRILITGAAGSIGSEMVRQVAPYMPAELILVDQAETPMHDMRLWAARFLDKNHKNPSADGETTSMLSDSACLSESELSTANQNHIAATCSSSPSTEAKNQKYLSSGEMKIETIVASITDKEHMEKIFADHRPDYVFHAAAFKHVPMMEDNPAQAVRNNIRGTRIIADLAVKYGTKKFVMISTDKAVNPTNVMGCSKRICEIYCQSLDAKLRAEGGELRESTRFITTRFGNVLGSNGSVIPIFKEQIKKGGPVTVTHKDIIRYFMLIPEACKLVLEAGTMGNGGEIFVFDMGKPVRIADLAKRIISLSGAQNIEIKYTGLRDGEKLYEEVLNDEEGTIPSNHPKIKIAKVREYDYETACKNEERLLEVSYTFDDMAIVKVMKEIVPEYKSKVSKYEILDKK